MAEKQGVMKSPNRNDGFMKVSWLAHFIVKKSQFRVKEVVIFVVLFPHLHVFRNKIVHIVL
ncbi:hypothetical protein HMPREF9420_1560 [Segatella salivae DSM 15606]|uniref:Uncharacterized protein n=1 Tax=Segatella salivae DSM 15606 TaxID=888832 RepID=E6MPZ2_9BACT|nr:hypothetical protein HMPREF9420_1560 [Segatella salivae DSM 15606]